MKRFYCSACGRSVRVLHQGALPKGTRLEQGPKGPVYVYRSTDKVCHHRQLGKRAEVAR